DGPNVAARGIVHENVEPAEHFVDFSEHALDLLEISHISLDHVRANPILLTGRRGLFSRLTVAEEVDHDVRALAGEPQGDCPSDTPARACYESGFPLKTHRVPPF